MSLGEFPGWQARGQKDDHHSWHAGSTHWDMMRTIVDLCHYNHRDVAYESLVHGQQGQKPCGDQLRWFHTDYHCQYFPENSLLIVSEEFGMSNIFEMQIVLQEAVCRCLDINIGSHIYDTPRS